MRFQLGVKLNLPARARLSVPGFTQHHGPGDEILPCSDMKAAAGEIHMGPAQLQPLLFPGARVGKQQQKIG